MIVSTLGLEGYQSWSAKVVDHRLADAFTVEAVLRYLEPGQPFFINIRSIEEAMSVRLPIVIGFELIDAAGMAIMTAQEEFHTAKDAHTRLHTLALSKEAVCHVSSITVTNENAQQSRDVRTHVSHVFKNTNKSITKEYIDVWFHKKASQTVLVYEAV